jgi:hypothetical protein
MLDPALRAMIAEASRQRAGNPESFVDLAQQEHSAIAAEMAAGEIRNELARTKIVEEQRGEKIRVGGRRKSGVWHQASLWTSSQT